MGYYLQHIYMRHTFYDAAFVAEWPMCSASVAVLLLW